MDNFAAHALNQLIEAEKPRNRPAEWTYERLVKYITSFEGQLTNEEEVGARLVAFGQEVVFHIEDLGFWNPDIISFDGRDTKGQRVKLIQHVSQLSVLLVAMQKPPDHKEPIRIGFKLQEKS